MLGRSVELSLCFFYVFFFFRLQQMPGRAAEIIVTHRVGLMEEGQL